jgi:hypothetical protein
MSKYFYTSRRFLKRVDTEYVEVRVKELKQGDRFIVKDPDGIQYPELVAAKDPVFNDDVWGIEADEWKEPT